jgi:hypothetical protein
MIVIAVGRMVVRIAEAMTEVIAGLAVVEAALYHLRLLHQVLSLQV